jgi:hypothetical protein
LERYPSGLLAGRIPWRLSVRPLRAILRLKRAAAARKRCVKSAGNAGIWFVIWDEAPNRCCIRLLSIALATAVCMVGIRVDANDWHGSDTGGRNSVELSSPATHVVAAVRVTRIRVGGDNFVPDTLPVGRLWVGVAEASPRAISLEPPNALLSALRALPLASRAPPLA